MRLSTENAKALNDKPLELNSMSGFTLAFKSRSGTIEPIGFSLGQTKYQTEKRAEVVTAIAGELQPVVRAPK